MTQPSPTTLLAPITAGATFGLLTVLAEAPSEGKHCRVRVRCACGTEKTMQAGNLRRAESCGCRGETGRHAPGTLAPGARCGKLVILSIGEREPGRARRFTVECACGVVKELDERHWGSARSCGCGGARVRNSLAKRAEQSRRESLAAAIRWGGAL